MNPQQVYKILIVGPESTGKTTLAQQLAKHYDTLWAAEFARSYYERKAKLFSDLQNIQELASYKDLMIIALGQIAEEEKLMSTAKKMLFCDAGVLSTKVYAEHYMGASSEQLLALLAEYHYDFCLLAATDVPWVADWQREAPHRREELLERFKGAIAEYEIPYRLIEGIGEQRVAVAIKAIDHWLQALSVTS